MMSFDITSLYTNVPVDEAINIITTLLNGTDLPTGYIDGVSHCLTSGYFLWRGDFYQQVNGVAMGSPLAPVVANIYMEWFEGQALTSAPVRPRHWWRYVDDVFAVINRVHVEEFIAHLNSVHSSIQFTTEKEKDGMLPFLDVLVSRGTDGRLSHTVYRKPTHTDRYLRADSHHHPSHLASVPRTLINRALNLCDPQYIDAEFDHLRQVLENNGYNWRQCTRMASSSTGQERHLMIALLPEKLRRPSQLFNEAMFCSACLRTDIRITQVNSSPPCRYL
ncbi:hypothetical protein HF086_003707 [Spodoptera exigua]|uniref:Reverse transcriptase domain-containing protein n=1 Tax=Spodoptera exigua TaxID=7107 RepID=A0A922M6L1_SPOEX|nr:hypothetical protein HF086_003707 [Spodoptera exigua]